MLLQTLSSQEALSIDLKDLLYITTDAKAALIHDGLPMHLKAYCRSWPAQLTAAGH